MTIHSDLIDIFALVDSGVSHDLNINIDTNYRGKAKELKQS